MIELEELSGYFVVVFGTGSNKQSLKEKNTNCLLNKEYD